MLRTRGSLQSRLEVNVSNYGKGSENMREEREQEGQKRRDLGRGGL